MAQELAVISGFYDFMLWLIRHTERFPRHHRYSLGLSIENRMQAILSLLLRAKYSRDKTDVLREVNLELEVLRFQVRLAKDLRALPIKSHGYAAEAMQTLGSQVGGWLRDRLVASGNARRGDNRRHVEGLDEAGNRAAENAVRSDECGARRASWPQRDPRRCCSCAA